MGCGDADTKQRGASPPVIASAPNFLLILSFLGLRPLTVSRLVLGFGLGDRERACLRLGSFVCWDTGRMEGKRPTASSPSSIADDLFGRKEDAASSAKSSSSSAGYFSSVFPPTSSVMGKDSGRSDLYWTLDKQRTEGRIGNAQSSTAEDKCQGSPGKSQTTSYKDGKSAYPIESTESPYFGSSVHYGGREFYSSSPSKRSSGAPNSYKNKDEDDLGDSNVATRGDWWQGSLYY